MTLYLLVLQKSWGMFPENATSFNVTWYRYTKNYSIMGKYRGVSWQVLCTLHFVGWITILYISNATNISTEGME